MCNILVIVVIPDHITVTVITLYYFSLLSLEIRKREGKRNK